MEKNKELVLSVILSVVFIISGLIGAFYIKSSMKDQVSTQVSKLGDVAKEEKKEEKEKDLKSIIYENQKLVVCIEVQTSNGKSLGSGFLYNDKGDIITNAHVVKDSSNVVVKMADTTLYNGTVIGRSDTTDVALVRVKELEGKKPMSIGKDKKVEIGDEVIALGSPLGLQNTATTGIISGLDRSFTIENYQYKGVHQISAPISPGNSGGPLLDKKTGQVIGINSAKLGEETIGFSIPINQVLNLVDGWSKNPSIQKGTNNLGGATGRNTEISKEAASYLVSYFYYSVNSKDYVTAYSLLGSEWQKKTDYNNFRQGYLDTASVKIDNIISGDLEGGSFKVVAVIDAVERNGDGMKTSKYKTTYTVALENNKLKIIRGDARKL